MKTIKYVAFLTVLMSSGIVLPANTAAVAKLGNPKPTHQRAQTCPAKAFEGYIYSQQESQPASPARTLLKVPTPPSTPIPNNTTPKNSPQQP